MHKLALVFSSALVDAGLSATYRGLMFAEELQRHGDDVVLVFDGAGTRAAAQMLDATHSMHQLLDAVWPRVRGVCDFCARAYGVADAIAAAGLPLLIDDRGHASLRQLLEEGRQIVTI